MLERVIELGSGHGARLWRASSMITFAEYANRWNGATRGQSRRAAWNSPKKAIEADESEPQGYIAHGTGACLAAPPRRGGSACASARSSSTRTSPTAYAWLGNMRDFQGRHEESGGALHARLPARPAVRHVAAFHGPRTARARPLRRGGDRVQEAADASPAPTCRVSISPASTARPAGMWRRGRSGPRCFGSIPNFSVSHCGELAALRGSLLARAPHCGPAPGEHPVLIKALLSLAMATCRRSVPGGRRRRA